MAITTLCPVCDAVEIETLEEKTPDTIGCIVPRTCICGSRLLVIISGEEYETSETK